jgi:hypothetical protein
MPLTTRNHSQISRSETVREQKVVLIKVSKNKMEERKKPLTDSPPWSIPRLPASINRGRKLTNNGSKTYRGYAPPCIAQSKHFMIAKSTCIMILFTQLYLNVMHIGLRLTYLRLLMKSNNLQFHHGFFRPYQAPNLRYNGQVLLSH